MIKSNKGITMVALIITIIILLILAVVSVNALVGENGLLEKAKESKFLTTLADVMFDLESSIIDINMSNIEGNRKYTSTEMIQELIKKDKIKESEDSYFFGNDTSLAMQCGVNDNRIKGLYLGFNGDLWYDNYKRGKIQLSTNLFTNYSQNAKTQISVIDGTFEVVQDNRMYILHSLKDRDDFVCWINQYGEIVSAYPDTHIVITVPGAVEYTAIYSKDLQNEIVGSSNNLFIGGGYELNRDDKGEYYIDFQITYSRVPHYYENNGKEVYNPGIKMTEMGVFFSSDYNKLLNLEADSEIDGDINGGLCQQAMPNNYKGMPINLTEDIDNYETDSLKNFETKTVDINSENYYVPVIKSYDDLKYTSALTAVNVPSIARSFIKNEFDTRFRESKEKRIYYRGYIKYQLRVGSENSTDAQKCNYKNFSVSDETKYYYQPTIKYLDLQ